MTSTMTAGGQAVGGHTSQIAPSGTSPRPTAANVVRHRAEANSPHAYASSATTGTIQNQFHVEKL